MLVSQSRAESLLPTGSSFGEGQFMSKNPLYKPHITPDPLYGPIILN